MSELTEQSAKALKTFECASAQDPFVTMATILSPPFS